MAVYFLDSSALVKRYISETGSIWISGLFDAALGHRFFVAGITGVEVVAAVTRRARGGSISSADAAATYEQFRRDFQAEYQVLDITGRIIDSGMELAQTHGLRGYDAIQLAAGCAVDRLRLSNNVPPIIFVSADYELNRAASNEKLWVENPTDHL
jgi:uncharacterized protein